MRVRHWFEKNKQTNKQVYTWQPQRGNNGQIDLNMLNCTHEINGAPVKCVRTGQVFPVLERSSRSERTSTY